jgi:ubiquinone biosynthesis protein
MGRLLAYLFEVTERFGMQTRTELILLQRTMVVVEGVARTLDPRMNIWDGAKPVVEGYIRDALGPLAIGRDLTRTLWILSRFAPRLPALARQSLIRTATPPKPWWRSAGAFATLWLSAGAVVGAVVVLALLAG